MKLSDCTRRLELFCAKRPLEGSSKYSRNETILKIGHLAKAIAHAKVIASCKMVWLGEKLKWPRNMRKTIVHED